MENIDKNKQFINSEESPQDDITKENRTLTRNRIFLLLSTVIIFLFFELGAFGGFNLGYTISYFAVFFLTIVYLYPARSGGIFHYICGAMSLVISVAFSINANLGVKFLSFVAVICLYAMFCGGMSGALIYDFTTFKSTYNLFYIPFFMSCSGVWKTGGLLTAKKNKNGKSGSGLNLGYLLFGLLLSVPLLAIILPLLRSDEAFDYIIGDILGGVREYILCLVLTLLLVPFFFGLIYKLKNHDGSERARYTRKSAGFVNNSLLAGVFIMVSIIYIVFIFSQLAYFFDGFRGRLPQGFSLANYARSGFFEMCWVTIINLAVIFASFAVCRKKDADSDMPLVIKLFSGFLCFVDLFMIACAMSKMVIYIENYGLTQKRAAVSVFMLALACLIICLVIRLIRPKFKYIAVALTIWSVIFAAYALADMDGVIAKYNIYAYKNGYISELDIVTVSELSESAIPELYGIYTDENFDIEIRSGAKAALDSKLGEYRNELENSDNSFDFRKLNLSHQRALNTLKEYSKIKPQSKTHG